MKKSTLLLFALFTILFQVNAQVSIGTGNSQNENGPFEAYYGYSYVQTVYLASEINASGDISDIQWYYSGTSDLANSQDLIIYMAESSRTEFTDTDDWEPISSFTQVYAGGITVTAGVEGWVTITLDTPFNYAGTGNLIVAVEENSDGFDGFGDDFFNSQVTTNRTISIYNDNNNPDPASPPTANNINDFIANVILGGITQACPTPSDISVTGITANEAELSWTENGTSTIWNIEIVPTGTAPTGTPTATAIPNPYPISSLTAITGYDIYLQSDCGAEQSAFAGPVTFSTLCDVFVPDYIETFTTIVPDCWDEASNGDATTGPLELGGGEWSEDGFQNTGVTGAYKINLWNAGAAAASDWLISPQFDLTGGPFQAEFDFGIMEFISSTTVGTLGSDDTVQLLITTDSGATWTVLITLDNTTAVPLAGITPIADLTAYSGQTVQFGILASEGTVDDPEDNDVFIDNFRVRNIPTCAEPTDLAITNITPDGGELSWIGNGTSTIWNVEIVLAGTAPTGTPTAVNVSNPYIVNGLDAITAYDFYIQTDCAGDLSSFSGPLTFSTLCDVFVPDYLEDFTTIVPDCWDEASNGDATTGPLELGGGSWLADEYLNTGENDGAYKINLWLAEKSDWIISPTFDLTGPNAPFQLEFDFAITPFGQSTAGTLGSDDTVQILITSDSGTTWTPLLTYDSTSAVPAGGEHQIIDLTAYNGSFVQFGILGSEGTTNDDEDIDVFVDNFEIVNIPDCTNPEAEYELVIDCDADQFSIAVDISDFGTANTLVISNDFDTNTVQATSVDDTYISGPYDFGTTVRLFITNEQDGDCVINSNFLQVLACPPANDNPCDATVAVVNDSFLCVESTAGTLLAATDSGVPAGSCGGNPDDDVWFQFVAQEEIQLISLANFPAFENIDHALYSGTCDALVELDCKAGEYSTITPSLTIGDTYFIRVFSGGGTPQDLTFDLCITPYLAPANISCDLADSYCSGSDATDILYTYNTVDLLPGDGTIDCLGTSPNPTYSILQIGSSGDILIEMVQNTAFDGNDNPIGDELDVDFLLWGPYAPGDDLCTLGSVVDCSFSAAAVENVTLIGAQQDEIYLLLITNYVSTFNPVTNGGIIQVRQTNISESGAGSTIADIEAEITSNEVVFVDTDADPLTPVEANVCGFETVTILADSPFADEYVWYKDGFVINGETSASLIVTESDNYQVQAFDNQCGADAFSQVVIVNLYEDAGTIEPQTFTVCDGVVADGNEDFNLDQYSTNLGYGEGFTVSYYTNTADANQAINAVPSTYNSSGETLIIRVEDTDAATNGFLGCRSLSDVELIVNSRPIIGQPIDFVVCDDLDGSVDGITDFNLASIDNEVTTDTNIVITYHTSLDDANNGVEALVSPYSSEGETIFVRAEDSVNSCFETTSFNIEVNIVPIATFDPIYDYEVCPDATSPVEIGLIPTNFSANEVTIQWFVNDVLIPGQSGLVLSTVLVAGEYRAVIEFNDTGCINDAVATPVIELETCVIPQGISPGTSPGLNDEFDLSSYNVTKLEIFNRNGTLVYSKNNYTNEWIGQTNDGEELPVGTYFYTMEYEGGTKKRSAWIYINR